MTSKLSFFISKLNEASRRKKSFIIINTNKEIDKLLSMLISRGFVQSFNANKNNKTVKVYLKVSKKEHIMRTDTVGNLGAFFNMKLDSTKKPFRKVRVISKISRQQYCSVSALKKTYNKQFSTYILSTTKGLLYIDESIKLRQGGQLLIEILL